MLLEVASYVSVGQSRLTSAALKRACSPSARERLSGSDRRVSVATIPGAVAGIGRKRPFKPGDCLIVPLKKQQCVAHPAVPGTDFGIAWSDTDRLFKLGNCLGRPAQPHQANAQPLTSAGSIGIGIDLSLRSRDRLGAAILPSEKIHPDPHHHYVVGTQQLRPLEQFLGATNLLRRCGSSKRADAIQQRLGQPGQRGGRGSGRVPAHAHTVARARPAAAESEADCRANGHAAGCRRRPGCLVARADYARLSVSTMRTFNVNAICRTMSSTP